MNNSANSIAASKDVSSEWVEIIPGERFKIRTSANDTEGIYTILEIMADPRNGVPLHTHANEEEHFVVLEGHLHLVNDGKRLDLSAGDSATVKRCTPHAWCNTSDSIVRFLVVFSPGHMERTFRRIASMVAGDLASISESAESDGSSIVGPPPFANIYSVLSPRPRS